ncbi:MAG: GDP-mannose 4,6-dehydratase [Nitrospirae bacterium]|nr:GDP-mannose 4,6-dehydratase [Nitrospirota bacterium]
MKALVTGGAGFIGSHLADRLIEEGHEVTLVDNLSTGKKENINKRARFHKMDILSPRLEGLFKKERFDIVSHHAAQIDVRRSVEDPIFDAQVNILGFLNILENAVRYGTKFLVFASSGGTVYGEQRFFPASEEHPTCPISPYGVTKLTSEQYLYFYRKSYGLRYSVLRYANVYGPRQDPFGEAGVVAIFAQKMLMEGQPVINGNGMQTRDYVYVDDVVDANMAVITKKAEDVFNVGTGRETSVNSLFDLLRQVLGLDLKAVYGPAKKGEQSRSLLDPTKLKKALDWEPRVDLEEGLLKTVEYFRKDRPKKDRV